MRAGMGGADAGRGAPVDFAADRDGFWIGIVDAVEDATAEEASPAEYGRGCCGSVLR